MQAVILAGGKGRRLEPYTTVLPKPLMPIGTRPVMEILLGQLAQDGIDRVVIAVGHLSHLIQAYFGDGAGFGLKITYVREDKPLGTAGPLGSMLEILDDDFLVTNGDLLTDISFKDLFTTHQESGAAATIAVFPREQQIDFGVLEYGTDGRLKKYIEKPTYRFSVSKGINVFSRSRIEKFLCPNQYLDIPDLMQLLVKEKEDVLCIEEDCSWLDIGRVDDYEKAKEIFAGEVA